MTFDVSSFMQAQFEGQNDTKIINCPAGEYNAILQKVEVKEWNSTKDSSKSGLKVQCNAVIDDPAVTEVTGRAPTIVRYEFMLDLTPAGGLDMGKGKNVKLGRLREALGLNKSGQSFSFTQLEGGMVKVKVSQRQDDRDPEIIYDQIVGVTAYS